MEKLCLCLLIAVITNEAVGLSFRHKRQLSDDDPNSLDDRYGRDPPAWQNQGHLNPSWRQTRRPQNRPRPNPNANQWQDGQNQSENPSDNQASQPTQSPNQSGSTTTTQSSVITSCINSCPVTSEYNPVCGTDGVTYTNPGRLNCAQGCGTNVTMSRAAPCPRTV